MNTQGTHEQNTERKVWVVRPGGRDYLSFEKYECSDLVEKRTQIHDEEGELYFALAQMENVPADKQPKGFIEETEKRLEKLHELDDTYRHAILGRYADSFKDNPSEILEVIQERVDSISHEAFLNTIKSRQSFIEYFEKSKKESLLDVIADTQEVDNFFKEGAVANYTNFLKYISSQLRYEIAVAMDYGLKEYQEILEKHVSKYYTALELDFQLFEDSEDALKRVTTNPVDYFRMPKDKAIVRLWQGKYRPGQNQISLFDLDLPEGEKEKIFASVTITSLKDLPGVKGIENLSADEELIYNSIYSHVRAGNQVLTDSMIYSTLMGNKKVSPSPKQTQEIEDFINMASVTQVTIDDKDRARLRGDRSFPRIKTNLLSVTKVEKVEINGAVVASAWVIDKEPVLGWWAEHTGQISSVPVRVLDTGTSSNYNWLRSYLIQQISWLKNSRSKTKRSNKILFDSIYEQNHITDRRYKERCRTQAFKMLDAWVGMGWITSYKLVYDAKDTKRKTPVAISIKYDTTEQIEAN